MPSNDLIGRISNLSDNLRKQMKSNLPSIDSEIEEIISRKDESVERIEWLLDTLLDYMNLGVGETEFKKLNKYYASFNKKNADAYNRFYQELKKG